MHLQFVGCGDAFGSGGRFNTCFHLVGPGINALIDCGASSMVALSKLSIERNDIDVILISHFHADHVGALPSFLLEASLVRKRKRPLVVAGPPGLKARYGDLMHNSFPGTRDMTHSFPLTLHELEIRRRDAIGAMHVTPFHVLHDDRAGPCLGFRIEVDGKIIAYSGDTQWTDTLIELGHRADLFICESYTRDKPIKTHMALSELERRLGQIRPKRLVLTHMSNDMLARRSEVQFETAEDGMIIEL
jgi:ribonuclease BN (tRNA processing enzyme)